MLNASLDAIVTIDHHGRIIEFNPAAERTFGHRRADILRKEMAELLIPARYRPSHRDGLARYLLTKEGPVLGKRLDMPALRADGTEFLTEMSIEAISPDGPPHPMFETSPRNASMRSDKDS